MPDEQRLILEVAKLLKVGYLQQNAYHKEDTYVPLNKQYMMMKTIDRFYKQAQRAVKVGVPISTIKSSEVYYKIIKMKYEIPNDYKDAFDILFNEIDNYFNDLIKVYEGD